MFVHYPNAKQGRFNQCSLPCIGVICHSLNMFIRSFMFYLSNQTAIYSHSSRWVAVLIQKQESRMKFIITTPWRRSGMIMTYITGDGLFGMGELCRQDELRFCQTSLAIKMWVLSIQNLAVWNYVRATATFCLFFHDMLRFIMISREAAHDKCQSV